MPSRSSNARSKIYQRIKKISAKRGEAPRVRFASYDILKAELERLVEEGLKASREAFQQRKQQKLQQQKDRRLERRAIVQNRPNYLQINATEGQDQINKEIRQLRRTFPRQEQRGVILKSRFFNNIRSIGDIKNAIRIMHNANKTKAYRIQIYMGVITKKAGSNEPYVWNNDVDNATHLFSGKNDTTYPFTVNNNKALQKLLSMITMDTISKSANRVKTKSNLLILGVYNILIKIFTTDVAMGCETLIPEDLLNNRYIVTFSNLKVNLCHWACLAVYKKARKDRFLAPAKKLFKEFYGVKFNKDNYDGFLRQSEIESFEKHFKIGVQYYERDADGNLIMVRRCILDKTQVTGIMNVLIVGGNHECLITDINRFSRSFKCVECGKMFSTNRDLNLHIPNCKMICVDKFPKFPKYYVPKENLIIQIAKEFGFVPSDTLDVDIDFTYDYAVQFDYEANLMPENKNDIGNTPWNKEGAKIVKTHEHTPISCSVNSNVPGYTVKCFVSTHFDNCIKKMNAAMYNYTKQASQVARGLMIEKFNNLFGDTEELIERLWDKENLNKPFYAKGLEEYISQIPLISFNGGGYDMNLNKSYGLISILSSETGGISFSALKANKYMAIANKYVKFLDMCNYLAPGTSYEKYVKAYGCDLQKGFFPYEWLDSVEKLKEDKLPPFEAFYSTLRSCNSLCTDDDPTGQVNYKMIQDVWTDLDMETMEDFLIWYNNLDVIPFTQAIEKQKQFYKKYGLDMFKDGISLPGLAEKIMFKEGRRRCDTPKPLTIKQSNLATLQEVIHSRIQGYKQQDDEAKRKIEIGMEMLTVETAIDLMEQSGCRCVYCWSPLVFNDFENLSFDRIDCLKPHIKGNLNVSCIYCNKSRSNTPIEKYMVQTEIRRINNSNPQVKLIGEENKEVFYMLKENVVGGPSIIFHRHHEVGETHITRPIYNSLTKEFEAPIGKGKPVKKIVGFDANALYLWALSCDMPCGNLKKTVIDSLEEERSLIADVKSGKFFGFLEVDLNVPVNLYDKFSEFPPIFKNDTITSDKLGVYMTQLRSKLKKPMPEKGERKLISSFTGEQILIYSPLLKWYLKHGLVVSKIHSVIKATPNKIFKGFTDIVSNARRDGDTDKSKAIIAEQMKLVGNSSFGRTGMDKTRHTSTKYIEDIFKAKKKVNSWLFRDLNEINSSPINTPEDEKDVVFEVKSGKKVISQDCPIQIASAVYQLAKLRMLEFYYDCLDKFIDRSDFQYVEMDTDSAYMGITGDCIEDLIKPHMKRQFEKERYNWFPDNTTKQSKAFNKRKPGLFKVEWEGDGIVALTSKMYYCYSKTDKSKSSAKGIQNRNNQALLTYENYKTVLKNGLVLQAKNKGFRVFNNKVFTYEQGKDGLSPIYDKRVLLADGVTTVPIME